MDNPATLYSTETPAVHSPREELPCTGPEAIALAIHGHAFRYRHRQNLHVEILFDRPLFYSREVGTHRGGHRTVPILHVENLLRPCL